VSLISAMDATFAPASAAVSQAGDFWTIDLARRVPGRPRFDERRGSLSVISQAARPSVGLGQSEPPCARGKARGARGRGRAYWTEVVAQFERSGEGQGVDGAQQPDERAAAVARRPVRGGEAAAA
jgi:hypothetical protein